MHCNFSFFLAQFIPIDLEKSVTDGVPDDEYDEKKADVDQQVTHAFESILCKDHLDNFRTIKRFQDGRSGRCGGFALNRRTRMASVGTRAVSAARLPLPAWCSRRIWAATATGVMGGIASVYEVLCVV